MGQISRKSDYINVICIVAVVGAFSISSLALVNMGGHLYRSMVRRNEDSNKVRTALSYVTTRIHEMDGADTIRIEKRMDRNVLIMKEGNTKEEDEILLYFKEGTLYEARRVTKKEEERVKENLGYPITRIESFTITKLNDNLIQCSAADKEGEEESITLNIRSRR